MNAEHRTEIGLDDLPFFHEYLENVLRPRVQQALGACEESLAQDLWTRLVETLMADPGAGGGNVSAAALRSLLKHKLGLTLRIELHAEFGSADDAPATTGGASPDSVTRAQNGDARTPDDVVAVRRMPSNPLAKAVFGPRRST